MTKNKQNATTIGRGVNPCANAADDSDEQENTHAMAVGFYRNLIHQKSSSPASTPERSEESLKTLTEMGMEFK